MFSVRQFESRRGDFVTRTEIPIVPRDVHDYNRLLEIRTDEPVRMAPCICPDQFEQNVSTVRVDRVPGSYAGGFLVNLPSSPWKCFLCLDPSFARRVGTRPTVFARCQGNVECVTVTFLTAVGQFARSGFCPEQCQVSRSDQRQGTTSKVNLILSPSLSVVYYLLPVRMSTITT